MNDPYLNELKNDFIKYSSQLKKLRKELLKANSSEAQSKIIKQIDIIAKEMEKNQKRDKAIIVSLYRKKGLEYDNR